MNIEIFPQKRISSHIHDYDSFKINLIPYFCTYISREILLLEHKDFKFIGSEELSRFNLGEADIPVIEELKNIYK